MVEKEKDLADFCIINPPEHRLSQFERLTLVGGSELERALGWISKQLLAFTFHQNFGSVDLSLIKDAAKFYGSGNFLEHPETFFAPPSEPYKVIETIVHGLRDGEILDLSWESTYRAQYPGYKKQYESYENNRTACARLWTHKDPAPATLIAIHGWTMGDQRVNSLAFLPGIFYRYGLDVALIELPFHGRRATNPGSGGDLFPSTDVILTNEAMGQAIADLRALKLYIEGRGTKNVGWAGVSLGGYVGSLWSGLDPLAFAIPIVPMTSMAETAWEILSREGTFRELKKEGLTRELLDSVYHVHSPLTHSPKLPSTNAFLIGGIGDKMVPARQVKLLYDHWKRPPIRWLRGGHAASFKRTKAFEEIQEFLRGLGYLKS